MSGITPKIDKQPHAESKKTHLPEKTFLFSRRLYRLKTNASRNWNRLLHSEKRQSGIKWAPRYVPLSRRLETLAIAFYTITGVLLPVYSYVLWYCLLYSRLWWLGLIYTFFVLHDNGVENNGGRRWELYRDNPIARFMARYSPTTLVKTAELDPTKNYIAPTCPHGQIMLGATNCFLTNGTGFTKTFPGIKSYVAMASGRFKAPFLRELNLFSGGVSAEEKSISYLMNNNNKGNFLCINLGGSAEVMMTRHDVYNVVVKNRKRYARIAIETGASIVPVFCFGETRAFNTEPYPADSWLRSLQEKIRDLTGITPIIARGRGFFQYSFGMIAFRTPITVVVGEPIEVKQNYEPTKEEIDSLHNKYMERLVELFETHKHKYEPDPSIRLVLM